MALRVVQAFDGHAVGDLITDSAEIAAITSSEQSLFAVAVADEVPTAPAAPKE